MNLVRWTIGGTTKPEAIDCLRTAVKYWGRIFGDRFERVVCYNKVSNDVLNELKSMGVRLVNQNEHKESIGWEPLATSWKLYPPRLNPDGYEVFIDNDVIIYDTCPIFELFLKSDFGIIAQDKNRAYGSYEKEVMPYTRYNSGFFGLPPGFDFKAQIEKHGHPWVDRHLDDQGLMAKIACNNKFISLGLEDLFFCQHNDEPPAIKPRMGIHFADLNKGKSKAYGIAARNFV